MRLILPGCQARGSARGPGSTLPGLLAEPRSAATRPILGAYSTLTRLWLHDLFSQVRILSGASQGFGLTARNPPDAWGEVPPNASDRRHGVGARDRGIKQRCLS